MVKKFALAFYLTLLMGCGGMMPSITPVSAELEVQTGGKKTEDIQAIKKEQNIEATTVTMNQTEVDPFLLTLLVLGIMLPTPTQIYKETKSVIKGTIEMFKSKDESMDNK